MAAKYLKYGWGTAAGLFLLFLPFIIPELKVFLAVEILIFSLFAISFNLPTGAMGMLPFGFATFFGMGAYTLALLFNHLPNTPLVLALFGGALVGLISAVFVGSFCVRRTGAYFALITLAFQMFFWSLAWKWRAVTKGDDGMPVPRPDLYLPGIGDVSLFNITNFYYVTLLVAAMGILAAYLFLKTPLGNAAKMMRENDERASFLGYDIFATKLTVFGFSGFLAGLAGGIHAIFNEYIAPQVIDLNMSFTILVMTMIGGSRKFFGPVVGVIFYVIFQDWLSDFVRYWWFFLGIVFILIILFLEGGIVSLFQRDRVRFVLNRLKG